MNRATLAGLLAARRRRQPVVRAVRLADGAEVLLEPGAAAGAATPLQETALAALREDTSRTVNLDDGEYFLHVHNPPLRLVMVGAVHVAQSLSTMARSAGHDVVVVDPRRAFASAQRFPGVAVINAWPDRALADLALDARTALVTLTHDPKLDDPALVAGLASAVFYIGALGSRRTHAARCERLRGAGVADVDLQRIHAPVGLSFGARTAGEIAISILAEITSVLRQSPD